MVLASTSGKTVRVSLRMVAEHAGVAPSTVSAVLNNSEASWVISQPTKDRIRSAARELNYRPNFAARSLRTKRTYTVAVASDHIAAPQVASTLAGAELVFRNKGYGMLLVGYDGVSDSEQLSSDLLHRGVEGVMAINLEARFAPALASIAVDCREAVCYEPLSKPVKQWLEARGRAAASALLAEIESNDRKQPVVSAASFSSISTSQTGSAYAAD